MVGRIEMDRNPLPVGRTVQHADDCAFQKQILGGDRHIIADSLYLGTSNEVAFVQQHAVDAIDPVALLGPKPGHLGRRDAVFGDGIDAELKGYGRPKLLQGLGRPSQDVVLSSLGIDLHEAERRQLQAEIIEPLHLNGNPFQLGRPVVLALL